MQARLVDTPALWTVAAGQDDFGTYQTRLQKAIDGGHLPAEPCFCSFIGYTSEHKCPDRTPDHDMILMKKRIGSPSSDAEVYAVSYNSITAALKVMPVISSDDEIKNMAEIANAIRASDLVKSGYSPHFPLVYSSGKCNNVIFQPDSKFRAAAEDYARVLTLRQEYPTKRRLIDALVKQIPDGIRRADVIAQRIGVTLGSPSVVPPQENGIAHLLLSEMAREDIRTWSQRHHHDNEWISIITQAIEAISHLHAGLNLCHNDLHLGNLLLLNSNLNDGPGDNRETIVLIHDFGRSIDLSESNWKDDYVEFLDNTWSASNISANLKEEVYQLLITTNDFATSDEKEQDLVYHLRAVLRRQ